MVYDEWIAGEYWMKVECEWCEMEMNLKCYVLVEYFQKIITIWKKKFFPLLKIFYNVSFLFVIFLCENKLENFILQKVIIK
jgi:hypothetical protein